MHISNTLYPTYLKYFHRKSIAIVGVILVLLCIFLQYVQQQDYYLSIAQKLIEYKIKKIEKKSEKAATKISEFYSQDSLGSNFELLYKSKNYKNVNIYIYNASDNLVFWNNNNTIPENINFYRESNTNFVKINNRYFTVKKKNLANGSHAIILGLVYQKYPYQNKSFKEGFVFSRFLLKNIKIISSDSHYKQYRNIHNAKHALLFSITPSLVENSQSNFLIIGFMFVGFLMCFTSLAALVNYFLKSKKYRKAFFYIVFIVIGVELVIYFLKVYLQNDGLLFSPNLYASKIFGQSLGALSIRVFMLFWLSSIAYRYFSNVFIINKVFIQFLLGIVLGVGFVGVFMLHRSLVLDSTLSFALYDINSFNFSLIVALVIAGLALVSLYFMAFVFYQWVQKKSNLIKSVIVTIILILGIQVYFETYNYILCLFVLLWSILILFVIHEESTLSEERQSFWLLNRIIAVAIFSGFSAIIFYNTSSDKEEETNRLLLKELSSSRDYATEFSLMEVAEKLKNNKKVAYYLLHPYMLNRQIDKEISLKYFNGFKDDYEIQTYLFNAAKQPLKGRYNKDFNYFQNLLKRKSTTILDSTLFYTTVSKEGEQYIIFIPIIKDSIDTIGFSITSFKPEIFNTFSAYPLLLKPDKLPYDEDFITNSYALYDLGVLVTNKGLYNYPLLFNFKNKKNKKFDIVYENNFKHYILYNKLKQVIYSKIEISNLAKLSLFSYIFIFYIILYFLSDFCTRLFSFWKFYFDKLSRQSDSLQTQIELSIISIVLMSLVVLSLMSLFYLRYQYNDNQSKKQRVQVTKFINLLYLEYEKLLPIYGADAYDFLVQNELKAIAKVEDFDINIYDKNGDLDYTTQPEIFAYHLFSKKMNPYAFDALINKKMYQYSVVENLDNLEYKSEYQLFKNKNKTNLGYFQFPYFSKKSDTLNDVSIFLVAIINVYVFMLFLAVYASIFISRRITQPLETIKKHIGEFKLDSIYKPIYWEKNDEIKLLVNQYNLTLQALADSAEKLARTERESAWREMAKQVAHEIKNPLTPMKLSIQLMQRKVENEDPQEVKNYVTTVSQRLIEQIDALTDIATAFSDFARMPQGKNEVFDIQEAINVSAELFLAQEIKISINNKAQNSKIFADKGQLIRVFNNLIKNAIQSISNSTTGLIEIEIYNQQDFVYVSLKDNGVGIEEDKMKYIFEPNFTTKSSGSGLGLAMCKSIIEQSNGKIWFETKMNKGTIFYIQLPKNE